MIMLVTGDRVGIANTLARSMTRYRADASSTRRVRPSARHSLSVVALEPDRGQ